MIALFILFPLPLLLRKKKLLALPILVALLVALGGCYQVYYKAHPLPPVTESDLVRLETEHKTFILHQGLDHAILTGIHIQHDRLTAHADTVAGDHRKFLYDVNDEKSIRVKRKYYPTALSEIHLYADGSFAPVNGMIDIPVVAIQKTLYNQKDKSANTVNAIFSTLGIVLLALGIVAIIIAISCNCPQVYVEQNGHQEFLSGMYSGAIYSTLERQDMLALPYDGKSTAPYQLSIANPAAEEQFINSERILEVDHLPGTHVLAERNGTLHSLSSPVAPELAIAGDVDVLDKVLQKDNSVYPFDDSLPGIPGSTLDLVFPRPEKSTMGKLLVHGGNSAWSGYVYKNFFSLFGDKYGAWLQRKEKDDPATMRKWELEQTLPLMVFLGTDTGWRFIDHLAMTGNTSSRDLVLGIDLKDIQGPVRIRLITAYRFWNLDQASMDFTEDRILSSRWLDKVSIESSGVDSAIASLSHNDNAYTHLVGKESIRLRFQPKTATDAHAYSYFLVGSGYYHAAVPAAKGAPDVARLLTFKEPHAFDAYSRELFNRSPAVSTSIARLDLTRNKK